MLITVWEANVGEALEVSVLAVEAVEVNLEVTVEVSVTEDYVARVGLCA